MAWIIGVDEAGYGPNLGPFVMCSVAWRLPDDQVVDHGVDFWAKLEGIICRGNLRKPGERILLDDSKVVHAKRGLAGLERGVLGLALESTPVTLADLLASICREGLTELGQEAWYTGASTLPQAIEGETLPALRETLAETLTEQEITRGPCHAVVVNPPRFNEWTEAAGSKGAVLARGLQCLVRALPELPGDDPLYLQVDKHGGRNNYAALLQDAFGGGMVMARQESAARSVYEVLGLSRKIVLCFQPRADANHATVALASMAAKYLREQFMGEFNAYFRQHLPTLEPTAGYPGDAGRFLEAIRPLLPRLNLIEEQLWRKK